MTNEEKLIEEHLGKQNPFRVPEGYFDSFADRLMQQLPEQQEQEVKPAKTVRMKALRPILVAAACVAVAIFSITPPSPATPTRNTWTRLPTTSCSTTRTSTPACQNKRKQVQQ